MKKKIVALFLALCLCASLLPTPVLAVEDVTLGPGEQEELVNFLSRFCAWSGDYYSADRSFPSGELKREPEDSDYSNGKAYELPNYLFDNVFEELLKPFSYFCYDSTIYPGEKRTEFWGERDPLGKWNSYVKTNAQTLDWILENIFNCPKTTIEKLKASALTVPTDSRANLSVGGYNYFGDGAHFYYLDGYYYSELNGTGNSSGRLSIDGVRKMGTQYMVSFSYRDEYDDAPFVLYALVARKTIGAQGYWSLYYLNSTADLEDPFNNGGFFDVHTVDYYHQPILWAVEKGITYGTSWSDFSPEATCTKAQILTFLWRANGQPEPTVSGNPFVDVNSSDYYYKAALWAAEKGMITSTTVRANDPCTRAMVVNYLWRLAGKPVTSGSSFTDVSAGEDAQAVAWAVSKGITNGTGNGKFSPNNICTRGQIVTFLYRAENPTTVAPSVPAWSQAYMDFLQNNYSFDGYEKGESTFQLAYIDGDTIPELVVGLEEAYHAAGAVIYTYYNGQVVEVDHLGAYGVFAYSPSQGLICCGDGHMGGFWLYFYRIDSGRDILLKSFESFADEDMYPDSAGFYTPEYRIDGQTVSRDVYKSELRRMDEATRGQFVAVSTANGMPIDSYFIDLIESAPGSLVLKGPTIASLPSLEWM